ncbi:SH2D3 protein, partial [Atractosteus spatula]|nr:SH2D3 protein [Atractosteus spatula]
IKWFGSLSNLSFRRSPNNTENKPALKQRKSLTEGYSYDKSTDDLDACPRSPSYARSSDMYSHMGTMPRLSTKGKDKSSKASKKAKGKGDLSRRPSQRQPDDFAPESPLLSALSSGSVPMPVANGEAEKTPSAQSEEPAAVDSLPSKNHKVERPPAGSSQQPSEAAGGNRNFCVWILRRRDLRKKKSPKSRTAREKQKPRFCAMGVSHLESMESRGEYVKQSKELDYYNHNSCALQYIALFVLQIPKVLYTIYHIHMLLFSKEKYLLDSPPEKLRRELEEELKLSSSDLRSHGWYHGRIPREVSETLVLRNGDFLIRDSLTSVGDYVLTSRWNHEVLHFKISKVLVKSSDSYSRVQYLLERESFDSVPALVHYYVGNRRPVSQQSGAHIYCPINRTLPLRYLEASFALANGKHNLSQSPTNQRGAHIKRRSVTMTDGLTTEKIIPHSPSTLHHKEAIRNCALSMDQIQEFSCPMSPVSETPLSPAYSSTMVPTSPVMRRSSEPQLCPSSNNNVSCTDLSPTAHSTPAHGHKSPAVGRVPAMVPTSPVMRRSSEPQLCPSSNNNVSCTDLSPTAHSTPAHGYYPPNAADPDGAGGHYCELRPTPTPGPLPTKSYVERLRVEETSQVLDSGGCPGGREELGEDSFTPPLVEMTSAFKPNGYQSLLVPAENKPLEMSVLKRVKELLAEVDAKTAAKHITKADCMVARILDVTKETQRMMGVSSGLELLTLPHGHQLRLDLLERFHTMSIMMAVDLLGCTGSTEERAALLHKTIQLAAELKSNLGNMFGFAAVMRALELPQALSGVSRKALYKIARLEQTWVTLRQRHTEGAILYEKKLKPFMKTMNDGRESCPLSNTSFPHIVPLLSLLERGVAIGEGVEPWESTDAGVDVVMSHLEAARTIAHHGGIYRTNAETKLQGFQERPEILEVFRTEFQMRLLWGSRGVEGSQAERYEKFDKVLTALSNKLEPPVRHSEL